MWHKVEDRAGEDDVDWILLDAREVASGKVEVPRGHSVVAEHQGLWVNRTLTAYVTQRNTERISELYHAELWVCLSWEKAIEVLISGVHPSWEKAIEVSISGVCPSWENEIRL